LYTGGVKAGGFYLFFLGENFGEFQTPVEIVIGGQPCLEIRHHGWSQTETLAHPWPNSGRPYLSCVPQETKVGEKTISIAIAYKSIFLKGPSSVSNSVLYARCFKDYYGLYGEHCVSCWHFKQKTRYSKAVKDGKLKIYATECSGEFTPGVGMAEPVAKMGFAILPPPDCMYMYMYIAIYNLMIKKN
jgi:hypothetical protein